MESVAAKNPAAILKPLNEVREALAHDAPILHRPIAETREMLEALIENEGGMRENRELWKRILHESMSKWDLYDTIAKLTNITPAVAESIVSRFPPYSNEFDLDLRNLRTMSVPVARILARHDSGAMKLPKIKVLPVDVARELGHFQRDLYLDGLEELPADVAKELAHHGRSLANLRFEGHAVLKPLSEETARNIIRHTGPVSFVCSVPERVPENILRIFAEGHGNIHLGVGGDNYTWKKKFASS